MDAAKRAYDAIGNPNPFPNPNQVKQLMCWRETYAKCGAATPEVGEI